MDALSITPLSMNASPKETIKSLAGKIQTDQGDAKKHASAMKTAKEFESSFLTIMLEQMWTGVSAEAPFGGGSAEKTYRSMIVGEYAKSISASGGIGIADHVYKELISMQEGQK